MKRHMDETYGYGGYGVGYGPYFGGAGRGGGKRQRGDGYSTVPPGKTEIRLLIQSRAAGGVIGKGGDNIKRLRTQYDATLSVPDSNTPERVLTIVADLDNCIECVRDILPRLEEVAEGPELDVRLLVHQSHAGAVIGRSGYKIKELREQTNTNLKVYSQCCPLSTDRVLSITGEHDKIIEAVRSIITMVADLSIKGTNKPYDTINFDPGFAHEYGGYGIERPFRGPGGGPGPGPGGPGRGGGRFSSRGRQSAGYGGGYSDPYDSYAMPPMAGRGRDPYPPFEGYGAAEINGGPTQATQVTIPSELGGTIIGKGGERINRIREESGAHIIVDPSQGSDERIITISGTQTAIQTAQYLLQQCVRSSIAGRKYLNEQEGH